MTNTKRARYKLELKQEAVRLVKGGQSIASAARTLAAVDQTLFNWVKARRTGKLKGAVIDRANFTCISHAQQG